MSSSSLLATMAKRLTLLEKVVNSQTAVIKEKDEEIKDLKLRLTSVSSNETRNDSLYQSNIANDRLKRQV